MFFMDLYTRPEVSLAVTTWQELAVFPLSTVVVLAMSIMWMVSITRGMVKAIRAITGGNTATKVAPAATTWDGNGRRKTN